MKCSFCDKSNHKTDDCRELMAYKTSKWNPTKTKSTKDDAESEGEDVNQMVANMTIGNQYIGFDTCASMHVCGDKTMLVNFRKGKSLKVNGWDGSHRLVNKYGDYPEFGEALFVDGASNLLSVAKLVDDGFELRWEASKNQFTVLKDGLLVRSFIKTEPGVYAYDWYESKPGIGEFQEVPAESVKLVAVPGELVSNGRPSAIMSQPECHSVASVNMDINDRDLIRAHEVQRIHESLGHPSDGVLSNLLRCGNILQSELVVQDINNARQLNGPCQGCLKGKMKHSDAKMSKSFITKVIGDLLHMDIMFFGGLVYLLIVDNFSGFYVTISLKDKRLETMKSAVEKVISIYKGYGHKVKNIRTDSESVFQSLESALMESEILPSYTAPENHERKAERAIQTVKSKARALIYGLDYKLPKKLFGFALEYAVNSNNMVPNVNHPTTTPNEMVMGRKINVKQDCRATFGEIAQFRIPYAEHDSVGLRSETGIVVGRVPNSHGVLKVFVPSRNKIVRRFKFVKHKMNKELEDYLKNHYEVSEEPEDEVTEDSLSRNDEVNLEGVYWKDPDEVLNAFINSIKCSEVRSDKYRDKDGKYSIKGATVRLDNGVTNDCFTEYCNEPNPVIGEYINWTTQVALKHDKTKAREAMKVEMDQMVDEKVFEPVHLKDVPIMYQKLIIPSLMVMKVKYNADGSYDKTKARFTAGGHRQVQPVGVNNSSPTVDLTSFFTSLAKASKEISVMQAVDVKGAFLKSMLPNKHQYMRLSPEHTKALVSSCSDYEKYVESDGSIVVRLVRALYGLKEAAQLWFINIRDALIEFGFKQSMHDQCVFYWKRPKGNAVICNVHVDDMFFTADCQEDLDKVNRFLKRKYKDITINSGDVINYLGMTIRRNPDTGRIAVSQYGYIDSMLQKYDMNGKASTPSTVDLFKESLDKEDKKLVDKTEYISKVMSLMYLAKRTRPDILKEVVYASTKCINPTLGDLKKVVRIFKYINSTKGNCLEFLVSKIEVCAYIDASHMCHPDTKGHGGVVISLGPNGGTIYAKSFKIKNISLSSCEAELAAGHEGIQRGLYVRRLLTEFGYELGPVKLYQDNEAAIKLLENNMSNSFKSKHINVRYFYAREKIDNGELKIIKLPTDKMIADVLTKPMTGVKHKVMVEWLLNTW
jgi:hypothetical protein